MRIPIKFLLSEAPQPGPGVTWGDVIDNWEAYSLEWDSEGELTVSQDEAPILDMFGDEGVSITKQVKDLKDASKLFTGLSKSFTVPASKKNNRIFLHYYNIDIVNGLDSRELIPCRILMNNTTYDIGNISVESVSMSYGKPQAYKIRFIGKLSELSRKIGQDKLTNLDWLNYNIDDFDPSSEFQNSDANEIVFPLASRSDRMLFNTVTKDLDIEGAKNIAFIDSTSVSGNIYGVIDQDLVGAMKVSTILNRIQAKYDITFSGVFGEDYIQDLYLWLHKSDKERATDANSTQMDNITYDSGSTTYTSLQFASDHWSYDPVSPVYLTYVNIQGTWTGDATLHIKVDGVIKASVSVSGDVSAWVLLDNDPGIITFEAESPASPTINVTINLSQKHPSTWNYENSVYDGTILVGSAGRFNISEHLPTMKITDFLGSLFKMFNIVAEVDEDLDVKGTHFDAFMNQGSVKDVSEYIDASNYNVERPNMYSAMRFNFSDPKVAMEIGYEKVNNKQYGELEYDLLGTSGVRLSGSEYKLTIDNQRIPLEPLFDLDDGSDSGVIYTQFADLKGAEQSLKPMFTYVARAVNQIEIAYDTGGTVISVDDYMMASNVHTDNNVRPTTTSEGNIGLYFGEELNEYNYNNSLAGLGLFNNFYKGLTAMMFDEDKRSVKFKSQLPQKVIKDLSLSDTLSINNSFYNINAIETNFLTGNTDLDLTLVGRSQLIFFTTNTIQITNDSSTQVLRLTYTGTDGFVTSRDIPVSSSDQFDIIGDISSYSHSEWSIGTVVGGPDNIKPSAITDLAKASSTTNTATLTWSAATDNVAVAGYRIYHQQNLLVEIGVLTSYTATGLDEQAEHKFDVSAIDAAGNEANKSNILIFNL